MILDSGNRSNFDTGAVRDIQEGKGRCDLLPLEVVSKIVDPCCNILPYIREFQETGSTTPLYAAIIRFTKIAYGECKPTMILEVSKHFEEGAKKYDENNWRLGVPPKVYINSAVRHYLKYLRGDNDEPHDRAFVWNLMCCIWEVDYHVSEN